MKTFAVTGAASGIGLATANRLVAAGHRVWYLDRDADRIAHAPLDESTKSRVHFAVVDVADEGEVRDAFRQVATSANGHLDGLVNSAGVVSLGSFEELSTQDWEETFRVNVVGSYLTIRAAVPLLRAAGGGSIVNLASMAGKLAGPYTAPYNASKAAVISLTRSAAVALAPSIRVNAVCPGVVQTPMYDKIDARLAALGAPNAMQSRERAGSSPLARRASADEVAAVIEFLLDGGSSYMTGEDVNITGGFVMH
jgi:NAD(P)-dependent dehydrogenase (short-subunit alcohol dehydrogenase family)